MDMLPASKSAPSTILPLSREQSGKDGQHLMLKSLAVEEEANNLTTPELDAEAPGPHILEIGTARSISEMEDQRPIPELEGQTSIEPSYSV